MLECCFRRAIFNVSDPIVHSSHLVTKRALGHDYKLLNIHQFTQLSSLT
jgi:hypothetical protein